MKLIRRSISRRQHALALLCSLLIVAGLWVSLSATHVVPEFFFPGPEKMRAAFGEVLGPPLWPHLLASISRLCAGVLLAMVCSVLLSLAIGINEIAEAGLEWLMALLKYVPVTALIPLSFFWVGIGETHKVVIVAAGTLVQVVPMLTDAIKATERSYIDIARVYGLNDRLILSRVVVPNLLPVLFDATRISFVVGWAYLIVAELSAGSTGLGFLIGQHTRFAHPDRALAIVSLIAGLGLLTDMILKGISFRLFRWAHLSRGFVEVD